MPEMGPSGLLSGDGKRGGAQASVLASILDSTHTRSYRLCGSIYYVDRIRTATLIESVRRPQLAGETFMPR